MTWGEFRKLLEAAGVRDGDTIQYIEIDPIPDGELFIGRLANTTGDGYTFYVMDKLE